MKLFEHYDTSSTPPTPVLTITIVNPVNNVQTKIRAYIDTGFSETLLLPEEYYEKLYLMLTEVDEDYYAIHGGIFPAQLKTVIVYIELNGFKKLIKAYIHPYLKKPLLGRSILNKFYLYLKGPEKTMEIEIP